MSRIALFGTSADPPTSGHQLILQWLTQHFDWVVVWAADNPFKQHGATLDHRMAMLQLLIASMQPLAQNISVHPELSFRHTLDTVKQARQCWPNDSFTLVVGSDLVPQLPTWYRAAELLSQVQLLVVPRPGHELREADLVKLQQAGATVAVANLTGLNVSSTAYRENKDAESIPASIAAYIEREHLYACQDSSQTP